MLAACAQRPTAPAGTYLLWGLSCRLGVLWMFTSSTTGCTACSWHRFCRPAAALLPLQLLQLHSFADSAAHTHTRGNTGHTLTGGHLKGLCAGHSVTTQRGHMRLHVLPSALHVLVAHCV
ncbi:hypothetical protein COO60DRAFT_764308 [Scenedesmus sp. NREL 46B-D3]|nr:hypothetical protein COO60DRAFT_764308 [Scenedesmus sp. NREL 46B-D3]